MTLMNNLLLVLDFLYKIIVPNLSINPIPHFFVLLFSCSLVDWNFFFHFDEFHLSLNRSFYLINKRVFKRNLWFILILLVQEFSNLLLLYNKVSVCKTCKLTYDRYYLKNMCYILIMSNSKKERSFCYDGSSFQPPFITLNLSSHID